MRSRKPPVWWGRVGAGRWVWRTQDCQMAYTAGSCSADRKTGKHSRKHNGNRGWGDRWYTCTWSSTARFAAPGCTVPSLRGVNVFCLEVHISPFYWRWLSNKQNTRENKPFFYELQISNHSGSECPWSHCFRSDSERARFSSVQLR